MRTISKIIGIFDSYLLKNNKSFIGLRTANELINNSADAEIQIIDITKVLELGLIPNSYVNSKGQWRIHLSKSPESFEDDNFDDENYEDGDFDENYSFYDDANNPSLDVKIKQKENGKKTLFAIVAILIVIYFTLVKPSLDTSPVSSYESSGSSAVYVVNTNTYAATSKSALDDMYIYLSNKDQTAFATAMMNGEILEIPAGTEVYLKKNHFSYTIVKMAGRTEDVFIVTDHLTKK